METKKKVILFGSIGLGLLGLGIFGWKKGWFSKKQATEENKTMTSLEKLISGAKKDEEKTETTSVSTASEKTTPTYQATGENNGLDLYHKMVSMCAECYDNKGNQKDTDYLVEYFKKRDNAKTYLMLKDIFPQNAVDLGMMKTTGVKGLIYKYFRKQEKKLYAISDRIG